MYVAINVDEGACVAKHGDPSVVSELAYVRVPPGRRVVVGHTRTAATLSALNLEEMGALYETLSGHSAKGVSYNARLKRVQALLAELPEDEVTLDEAENMDPQWTQKNVPLEEKGASRTTMSTREPKVAPERKHRQSSGSNVRPKEGTTTGRVWAIADMVLSERPEEVGTKPFRADVVARCQEEGINSSTATTQYGKWNKARNTGAL